jgi:transposase-like protein
MTAVKKIAQKRLTLLQLAERIRNVSEACRHHGISRSQFYEYKRAFQEQGFDGLVDRPPIPKSSPNETPPACREKILAFLGENPSPTKINLCSKLLNHYLKQSLT